VLKKLLDNGLMPVVSPLSADEAGTLLNINADTVAAALGAALGAEKLILCTGAPGILGDLADPGSLISYTDLSGLRRLREEGRIAEGMLPRPRPSRMRSAAACGACTWSPTSPRKASWARCSPTRAPAP
jgi:acetylglutamate kinase